MSEGKYMCVHYPAGLPFPCGKCNPGEGKEELRPGPGVEETIACLGRAAGATARKLWADCGGKPEDFPGFPRVIDHVGEVGRLKSLLGRVKKAMNQHWVKEFIEILADIEKGAGEDGNS